MELIRRFEKHYIPVTESGCWLWIGSWNWMNYGNFRHRKRSQLAHRISWEIYKGPIPEGLFVLHKCDVPSCVNPDHLFLGTQVDNIRDAVRKCRFVVGEKNGQSKLTENQAKEIKKDKRKNSIIAKEYMISPSTICDIQHQRRWRHI